MGLFDFVRRSVGDLYIASPPEAARALIWRHPDTAIPTGAQLTVRSDEMAVFFRDGRPAGALGPGVHRLESENIPFLNNLIVGPLTGNRHCLAELFFVRRAEHLHGVGPKRLGTFTDVDSQHVVTLSFRARFSLRVHEPITLITTLGGQVAGSAEQVMAFIDGRITTVMSAAVGQLASVEPVARVASNQFNEQIGQFALERSRNTLLPEGLEVLRFVELELALDAQSEAALRDHGRKRAEIGIQREGVELAAQPGFAEWNLVQGQRAVLEGLGQGLASGSASMPVLGFGVGPAMGLGAPAAAPLPPATVLPRPVSTAPRLAGPPRWYLRTPKGIEGPLSARQVVMRAGAAGIDGEQAEVRPEHGSAWGFATEHDELAAEFQRRASARPALASGTTDKHGVFERALASAAADGVITADELTLLAPLAESTGLASGPGARDYVIHRARALGCEVRDAGPPPIDLAPPPPPPPAVKTYAYSNGIEEARGLSAAAVARRMREAPDGVHNVWAPGMPAWASAQDVEEIRRALTE